MAFSCFEGTLTGPGATGNQSYSGVGFQPKAMLFWATGQTADGYAVDAMIMVGMATDSTHRCVVRFRSDDAVNPTSTTRGYHNGNCILYEDSVGNQTAADLVSMDADGFTLSWGTLNTASMLVHYLALGGADLTNTIVKEITKDSLTTGNEAYTGFGFQPDAVIVIGNLQTVTSASVVVGKLSIGAAISSSARWALAVNAANGQSMTAAVDAMRNQRSTALCLGLTNTATIDCIGDLASFDSDGLTINWSDVPATDNTLWSVLALKGGQYACGVNAKPTGAATANQDISVGFTPVGVFLQSFGIAATDVITADAEFSVGGSDGTREDSVWIEARDAVLATESNRSTINAKALRLATGVSTTDAECDADFSAVANTVRLAWTTNNAVAASIAYLAFGSAAAAAGDPVKLPELSLSATLARY